MRSFVSFDEKDLTKFINGYEIGIFHETLLKQDQLLGLTKTYRQKKLILDILLYLTKINCKFTRVSLLPVDVVRNTISILVENNFEKEYLKEPNS